MLGKFFKSATAIILAFLSFALISQALIFVGPVIGGVIITSFNLSYDPQLAKTMESAGNILVLVVSVYVGVKVYKKSLEEKQVILYQKNPVNDKLKAHNNTLNWIGTKNESSRLTLRQGNCVSPIK